MFNLIGKIIITFYVFSLLFNLPSAFAQTRAGIVDTVWGNRLIRFQRAISPPLVLPGRRFRLREWRFNEPHSGTLFIPIDSQGQIGAPYKWTVCSGTGGQYPPE